MGWKHSAHRSTASETSICWTKLPLIKANDRLLAFDALCCGVSDALQHHANRGETNRVGMRLPKGEQMETKVSETFLVGRARIS